LLLLKESEYMPAKADHRHNRARSRREEILGAARELFFAKGYHGTTIEQVARLAGYSKRAVYLDFLNKDELFITLCVEGGDLLFQRLNQSRQQQTSLESGIELYLKAYIDFSREQSEYYRMIFSEATPEIIANCSEALRARLEGVERACLGVLVDLAQRAMREGVIPKIDPWEAAVAFLGSATGIIQLFRGIQVIFSREALESLARKTTWMLWAGLTTMREPAAAARQHGREDG
jgi:AcrR family transcriptional regulator